MTCDFCFRHCTIEEGKTGWCRKRTLHDGKIISVGYGLIPAIAIDPVEKKPLYHFLPGSHTLSLGASGCNFSCDFCQNWTLSQNHEKGRFVDPEDAVAYALIKQIPSISFTYSEPIVWQDYMAEAAEMAHENRIRTIMVTNGSFSNEALERVIPLIDAFNVDLKGDESFYRDICHGEIGPVLDSIDAIEASGKHIEVTTMIIEGIHTEKMISQLGNALSDRGIQVWHLSRFFPHYKMNNINPTSELFLNRIINTARTSGIPFIYPGNSILAASTSCPQCGKMLRKQPGMSIRKGECPYCGYQIYGIWE